MCRTLDDVISDYKRLNTDLETENERLKEKVTRLELENLELGETYTRLNPPAIKVPDELVEARKQYDKFCAEEHTADGSNDDKLLDLWRSFAVGSTELVNKLIAEQEGGD